MSQRRSAITLIELLVVIAILVMLVALLLPAVRSAREPARRNQCINQLKQIALALHNYADANGSLPPAYTVDEEGNRLHSWRTLLLPYVEQQALYDTIDLTKPWDDPANDKARETIVDAFLCPSCPGVETLTTYQTVVGEEFIFTGEEARTFSEVTDQTAQTVAVIDVDHGRAVHWMSPEDTDEETFLAFDSESLMQHPGILQVAFLDGHVKSIKLDENIALSQALLTIAGGEKIEAP